MRDKQMRKKCDVTASEMLEMRNQGLSNRDIANCLDISYATVLKYIGKQGGHMDNLAAFKCPEPKQNKPEEAPLPPKYAPRPTVERYDVEGYGVELNHLAKRVTIGGKAIPDGAISVDYDCIPDLVQFLAWAMRTRINIGDETHTL
jgi:hypothetical protein